MTKKQFLTSFFDNLNKANLDYFVYGEYKYLPKDTGGSDIDIVIFEKDMSIYEQVIKKLLNNTGVYLASFYANANAKFYRFINNKWGVQIDIFFKGVYYKGCPYYPIKQLKNNITLHNGIKVLDIKKGYYVDFYKEIIHKGSAKEKYIKGFIEEVNSNPQHYYNEMKELYGQLFADTIIQNLSIENLQHNGTLLQKLMYRTICANNALKIYSARMKNILRLFQKKPGYVIVVEGTDGSGKSTIISAITPIINEGFHHGVVYNHLRPNVIPDLGVLLGNKKKSEATVVVTNPHAQESSGLVGSLFRWSYYMIDYTIGYMKSVWLTIHSKSKVFIFDRYYYDYYIDQHRSRTSLPNWILKFGECFVPNPDLILCLGGNPKKIYERKPETSLEEVTRQTITLQKFCKSKKNAVWIDTTTTPEESINAAMEAVVKVMSKRFK